MAYLTKIGENKYRVRAGNHSKTVVGKEEASALKKEWDNKFPNSAHCRGVVRSNLKIQGISFSEYRANRFRLSVSLGKAGRKSLYLNRVKVASDIEKYILKAVTIRNRHFRELAENDDRYQFVTQLVTTEEMDYAISFTMSNMNISALSGLRKPTSRSK